MTDTQSNVVVVQNGVEMTEDEALMVEAGVIDLDQVSSLDSPVDKNLII